MASSFPQLLERVKTAVGADRELDAAIATELLGMEVKREPNRRTWRVGHRRTKTKEAMPWQSLPRYSASIDDALVLVPFGWDWTLESGKQAACVLICQDGDDEVFVETAPSLPLAILAAVLSAHEAQS
jgi:hypothetical protein